MPNVRKAEKPRWKRIYGLRTASEAHRALSSTCGREKDKQLLQPTEEQTVTLEAILEGTNMMEAFDKRSMEWKRMCREMHVKADIDQRKKLLLWLGDHTLNQILDWYECVEMTTVKTPVAKRRWSTKITQRDALFLTELGVLK